MPPLSRAATPRHWLLFLPVTPLVAVPSYLAPRIASHFGRLVPIVAGQLSMIGGLFVLALLEAPRLCWSQS